MSRGRYLGLLVTLFAAVAVLQPVAQDYYRAGSGGPFAVGAGGAVAGPSGFLSVQTGPVSTTDLAEDTLFTYTLPANTLSANQRGVRVTAFGNVAANANAKTIILYFGTTTLQKYNAGTASNQAWHVVSEVLRTGAATQIGGAVMSMGSTNLSALVLTPTADLTTPIVIRVTGQGPTTIGDVTAHGFLVETF